MRGRWNFILTQVLVATGICAFGGAVLADEDTAELERRSRAKPARDANGAAMPSDTERAAGFPTDVHEIDRVIVTGTNISTSDSPPFVPESIFNREAVERTGSRSLGDFFQSLPQNSGPTFTENQNDSLAAGGAAVALRGLSPDATLVLVNGRRVAP